MIIPKVKFLKTLKKLKIFRAAVVKIVVFVLFAPSPAFCCYAQSWLNSHF